MRTRLIPDVRGLTGPWIWEHGRMVVELALLPVKAAEAADFESAFERASAIIASTPGFRSLTLSRCVERPDVYLLLVEWEQPNTARAPRERQSGGTCATTWGPW